ncbi:hypothetical protein DYB37_012576 [Aphanomyces astaci]|uniref:TLDc domain-containing protein n=1 Tax=Aphanomyces astaci TaxID=112090 RepID=A0A397FGP4_APHAT|nr:hypothetical protein DYB35_009546 [Aphanomyces astaci]RHZ24964.1 hypothetical protein DYB37_012576 [Aphanomyces astaci]RHZ31045.1 hypothetical protein DYB31_003974 [Aphanomyces astaci]
MRKSTPTAPTAPASSTKQHHVQVAHSEVTLTFKKKPLGIGLVPSTQLYGAWEVGHVPDDVAEELCVGDVLMAVNGDTSVNAMDALTFRTYIGKLAVPISITFRKPLLHGHCDSHATATALFPQSDEYTQFLRGSTRHVRATAAQWKQTWKRRPCLSVATLPLTLTFRTPALYLRYLRQHPATTAAAAAATTSSTSMSRAMFPPSKEYKAKHKVIGSPLAANDKGEWHTAHAKLKQNKWLAYFEASVVLKRNHVRILTAALPPHLQCHHWKLLFTTQEHGFNSSVMYHRVHDRGPTVVAIKDSTDQVFGAFTPSSLKHSKKVYGNGRAFVFQHKSVYGWSGLDSNFVYGGPSGSIIWGGGPTGLALCLQLDEARGFTQPCDTFDSPALTHPHQFHCWAVEVWGFEGVKL